MAIYHLSVKPVQRSKGRSATAAAAYRAGEKIKDERQGIEHDYTRRYGVEYTEIITPKGIEKPERADLWNMAEQAERRKDGTTAREYEVALPDELDAQQRRALALDFAQRMADRHGIAADVCIHAPDKEGDNRNHHAHILTTTRKITANGLGDKAEIEKAGRNRRQDLTDTRELWAIVANEHLAKADKESRIDHRTLAAQGINRQPQIKMGWKATEMERQGIKSDRGDLNRLIAKDNHEIIILSKNIVDLSIQKGKEDLKKAMEKQKEDFLNEGRAALLNEYEEFKQARQREKENQSVNQRSKGENFSR